MSLWKLAPPALLVAGFFTLGCGGGETEFTNVCEGRELVPHLSPVSLGEFRPLGSRTADLTDGTRTPFEWPLILHAPCDDEVTISNVCIVGDAAQHFALEGPSSEVARRGEDSAVRLTYNRQTPHDGDAQDDIAIIVESNADGGTIVVPVCARVVDGSPSDEPLECNPPAETSCS